MQQYVKIKTALIEQIESGMLAAGQKLPSERKLAESFQTTRVTLREALSLLEAEGRIFREDRRGWFIASVPLSYSLDQAMNFTQSALAQQRSPATICVQAKLVMANKTATRLLQLPPFSDVYQIERVRMLESRPVANVVHYSRAQQFPALLEQDLNTSLTTIYARQYGLTQRTVHYEIYSSSLQGETAQQLRATAGTPAMVVERLNYTAQGELFSADIEFWRHDAIRITSRPLV